MMKDIVKMTAAELELALENRELSSWEITSAFLDRIDEKRDLNMFISVCREAALKKAEEADASFASAIKKIPFAVKDNIAVAGEKMTCASHILDGFVPPYTSSAVERLGGIVLGKTNLDEFAMGSSCEKSIIGATVNPYSKEIKYSAGGSSGGSAVSVASFSSPWALGSDTGGSARQPASFCGIVAMKPTYGLVSRFGLTEFVSSMDTVCPMTKNVYDNALMLGLMAGHDCRDMTSCGRESYVGEFISGLDGAASLGGLRIGIVDGYEKICSEDVIKCTRRAAEKLEGLGASVGMCSMPAHGSMLGAYLVISEAECSSNLSRFDGLKYGMTLDGEDYREIVRGTRASRFGDEVKRRIIAGGYALSETYGGNYYPQIKGIRAEMVAFADKIFEEYDILLTPTTSETAFELGKYDDDPTKLYMSDVFTVFANLTGIPSLSIPSGGDGSLPCGVSLMSKKYGEPLLYRVAYALENELCGYIKAEVREIE